MAEITQKPGGIIILTSADVTTNVITGYLTVRKIRWVGATTIGDSAVLCDMAGNTFYESKCAGTFAVEETRFSPPQHVNGMTVKVLASGNLYLYVQ